MDRVYPRRINWQNLPSTASPINETNLNKIDYAVYEIDGRVVDFDITKADQSDLLQTLKSLTYDPATGVFVFTYWNGGTLTVDLNIEKIPVSFSMSPQGVITMTTADGTTYTADVASLIKQYTFNDSTEIDFTTTTDASGNKTITASLKSGSITGDKLQPNYLADCVSAKNQAQSAATNASNSATASNNSKLDSEAWAIGTRNGQAVPSTDPAYHNNSKYWSEQAGSARLVSLQDVQIDNVQDGDALVYDGANQKWVNGTGMSSEVKTSSDGQFTTVTGGLMQSCVVDLEPIQSGSGTPSPSNIRTISGHTQVQVGCRGKNLLKVTATTQTINGLTFTVNDDGSIKISGTATANTYFYPIGGTIPSYLVGKSVIVNGSASGVTIRLWRYDGTNTVQSVNGNDSPTATISTTNGAVDVIIWNGTTVNTTIYPMLRLATETDATFEPYNGYTVTIDLGGTYYGGTLDAVSGVLTVTHKYTDITAFTMRNGSTANKMFITDPINDALKPTTNAENVYPISNRFDNNDSYLILFQNNIVGIALSQSGTVGVAFGSTSEIDTLEEANSWLSSNPLQLCYELATPQTIQLDPQTLETLVGQNDVFTPLVGQSVEEVEFREVIAFEDVEKCISEKTELEITYSGFEGPILIQKNRSICNVYFSQIAFSNDTSATKDLFFNNVFPEGYEPSMNIAIPVLVFNRNTNSFDTLRIAIYGKDMGNMRGAIVIFNVPANSSYYLQTFFTYITG